MTRFSFTEHPRSVNESYTEHMAFACRTGSSMIKGGIACMLHGVFPFLFTTTGSCTIRRLYERINGTRSHNENE